MNVSGATILGVAVLLFVFPTFAQADVINYTFDDLATTSSGVTGWSVGNQTTGNICNTLSNSPPNSVCELSANGIDYAYNSVPTYTEQVYVKADIFVPGIEDCDSFTSVTGFFGVGFNTGSNDYYNWANQCGKVYGSLIGMTDIGYTAGWQQFGTLMTRVSSSTVVYTYYLNGNAVATTTPTTPATQYVIASSKNTDYPRLSALDNYTIYTDADVPALIGGFADITTSIETRITDVDITLVSSSTEGATVLNFDVTYFLNQSEINTTISQLNPDLISIKWSKQPTTEFTTTAFDIDQTVQGFASTSNNLQIGTIPQGTYDVLIEFTNYAYSLGRGGQPFPMSYLYTSFVLNSDGELVSQGPVEQYNALDVPLTQSLYTECNVTAIDGCLKNVVVWALVPPEDVTSYLTESLEQNREKVPFNYAFAVYDVVEEINNSTSTFDGLTIPTSNMFEGAPDFELIPSDFWATGTPKDMSDTMRPVSVYWIYLVTFLGLGMRSMAYVRNIKNE